MPFSACTREAKYPLINLSKPPNPNNANEVPVTGVGMNDEISKQNYTEIENASEAYPGSRLSLRALANV